MAHRVCAHCGRLDTGGTCGRCGQVAYCNAQCLKAHYNIHCRTCLPIEGKRGRNDDNDIDNSPCDNEEDPFTLEAIRDLPPEQVYAFNNKCYHLPSLYDWLINNEKRTDPLTNLPVPDEIIEDVQNVAQRRFPLQVSISSLGRQSVVFHTTRLINGRRLFMETVRQFYLGIVNADVAPDVSTIRAAIMTMVQYDGSIVFKMSEERRHAYVEFLSRHEFERMDTLLPPGNTEIKVYIQQLLSPPTMLAIYQALLAYFRRHGWPTRVIDRRIQRLEATLSHAERQRAQYARIKQLKEDTMQPMEPAPGAILVNLAFNTEFGAMYGNVPVYAQPNAYIDTLLFSARGVVNDVFPNLIQGAIRGYIYGGRMYNTETRLSDLPNFQEGNVIHVIPRQE